MGKRLGKGCIHKGELVSSFCSLRLEGGGRACWPGKAAVMIAERGDMIQIENEKDIEIIEQAVTACFFSAN